MSRRARKAPARNLVTRSELAKALRATDPAGTDFVVGPACHVATPMIAVFTVATGVLRLECAACRKLVVEVPVASEGRRRRAVDRH